MRNTKPFSFSAMAVFCVCLAACTPAHNVKPLPNFVEAALEPGDKVSVTTQNGETREFVVTEIRDGVIYGEDHEIPLSDIHKLQKIAWKRPESPCGGEKSLGCSVPLLVQLASEHHRHFGDKFYDACAQHDYCYRHGYRSYGVDREACDTEFLDNMRAHCPEEAGNALTRALQVLDDSVDSRSNCLAAADDFYAAVRRYGEEKFLNDESTYCEYNGPPPGAAK